MTEINELSLMVLEGYTRDVGRGAARISYKSMDSLNPEVSTGDILRILGKRATYVKALPLYPSDEKKEIDENKGIIRMDGLVRHNAGVEISDTIRIRKALYKPAEKVVVRPLEQMPPGLDSRYLADALESVPITKEDAIRVPYFGGRLTFGVNYYLPKDSEVVVVTQNTIFKISETEKRKSIEEHISDLHKKLIEDDYKLRVPEEEFLKYTANSVNSQLEKDENQI